MSLKILFYGDGNTKKGIGHLVRALGYSFELQNYQSNYDIYFAGSRIDIIQKIVNEFESAGLKSPQIIHLKNDSTQLDWPEDSKLKLEEIFQLRSYNFDVVFIDGKLSWDASEWGLLLKNFRHVVCVDCIGAIDQPVSGVIFPNEYYSGPTPSHKKTRLLFGENWIWLHPGIKKLKGSVKVAPTLFDFAVQMGGADPANLALQAAKDLKKLNLHEEKIIFLIGPEYKFKSDLSVYLTSNGFKNTVIETMTPGFHEKIYKSKLLLCAYGLIAREAEYLGVSSVLYHHNPDHLTDLNNYLNAKQRSSTTRELWLKNQTVSQLNTSPDWPRISENLSSLIQELCAE